MAGTQNSNNQKILRVPDLLLKEEKNKNDYYPKAVSIGPYHHKDELLASVEAFKPKAVEFFTSGNKEFYYNIVFEMIDEIRNCYEQKTIDLYSDADLAQMMLQDASFIITYMEISAAAMAEIRTPDHSILLRSYFFSMISCLGRLTIANLPRDIFLLENQIPLRVIKVLIDLRYGEGETSKLLDRYMNLSIFGEYRQKRESSPQKKEIGDPLHLLEAFHRLVVSDCVKKTSCVCFKCRWLCCLSKAPTAASAAPTCCTCTLLCCSGVKKEKGFDPEIGGVGPTVSYATHGFIRRLLMFLACKKAAESIHRNGIKKLIHSFRTVADLKAKGIFFKPSHTQSLKDVNFKSYFFFARLELPEWGVSIYTKVFFLNLVAYELSPSNRGSVEVATYINFMRSLIERPEDVKELRERKILYNLLGSDEEVLSVYRDINTYGAHDQNLFHHVNNNIQAHYNSRIKTWIAELIHTNFRSPWTITTFLAAVALLAISAGQLHYAVHPAN